MLLPRTVTAHLVERLIFNFRVKPEALASHLPVSYLRPQVFHGWSIVSFCILKLDQVRTAALPAWAGLRTTSCAYRCGVIDTRGSQPLPAVYVLRRYTDHPLISSLGPHILASTLPKVHVSLPPDKTTRVVHIDNKQLNIFSAEVRSSGNPYLFESQAFASLEAFLQFIGEGIVSYTPSIDPLKLARVDLHKTETHYTAIPTTPEHHLLTDLWPNTELIFDSAVRATGGLYKWTYYGLDGEDR